MPSAKLNVARFLSIPEIILTWIVEKFLDFILKHAARRTRRFIRQHERYDFYDVLLRLNNALLILAIPIYAEDAGESARSPAIGFLIEDFLITHRRMHERGLVKEEKLCRTCQYISENRTSFEKAIYVSMLYPPYKFTKGERYVRKYLWRSGAIMKDVSD